MSEISVADVLTVPAYRKGPSVLGLLMIGVLFLTPGFIAPVGVLQIVGALWVLAAIITALRDVSHVYRSHAT